MKVAMRSIESTLRPICNLKVMIESIQFLNPQEVVPSLSGCFMSRAHLGCH